MGRSISTPRPVVAVCYREWWPVQEDPDEPGEFINPEPEDWELFEEYVRAVCLDHWPSLREPVERRRWIGREDQVLLENEHARIGVSEFMGLAAVWLVSEADYGRPEFPGLANAWCAAVEPQFRRLFGELVKLGTMSNGESVYRRPDA